MSHFSAVDHERIMGRTTGLDLVGRLSPEVQKIVRLDLIQTIGCFLRHARNDKVELESIAEMETQDKEWGNW